MSKETEDIARRIISGEIKLDEAQPSLLEVALATQPVLQPAEPSLPGGKPDYCRSCSLYAQPGPVWGDGPPDAKLAVFGQMPADEEVDAPRYRPEKMKPFVGGSGRMLTVLLAHAGVSRPQVFIDNVVRCQTPFNRVPTPAEIACCSAFTLATLRNLRPNVVVAAGEVPFHALTGKSGISDRRGVPVEGIDGFKVFPTWHPLFIAKAQYNWPFAVHDLVRAAAQSAFPEIRRAAYVIEPHASLAARGEALLAAARARSETCFDFETTGLSPRRDHIKMVGLTEGPDAARVFDWTGGSHQLLQTIFDSPEIEIIGQNILYFDLPFAEGQKVDIRKAWQHVFDTMVVFHLCNSSYGNTSISEQTAGTYRQKGMDKDLSMIASCYTDMEHWKTKEAYGNPEELRQLCGKDCIATHRAAVELKKELRSYDMLDLYYKHVLPVHPVLHRMTQRGMRCDEGRAAAWRVLLEQQADELEAKLREDLGDPWLNLASPKQLMKILYEQQGLPVQYGKTGKPTVDKNAIAALVELAPENQALSRIVDVRKARKLGPTYIDPGLQSDDCRFHPRFGVSKTANGRFNSWDPNGQNVPELMRELWIADDDEHVVLAGDASQIEWRIAMVLSGDPVGLELLARGVDTHKAVYGELFGIAPEDVSPTQRTTAKFVVYGLGYGRGTESISEGYNLPMHEVVDFVDRFSRRFAVYWRWRNRIAAFARKHNYLANAFKRRRWWYTSMITEQYNYLPSSTAADMMYVELMLLDEQLPKGATLRLTVHDEIVVVAPKDVAKQAYLCMKEIMERSWPHIVETSADEAAVRQFYPGGWYCPVDLHIGTNWKMCKSKDPADIEPRQQLERSLGL